MIKQLYHLFWMQYDKFIAHGRKSNIEKRGPQMCELSVQRCQTDPV